MTPQPQVDYLALLITSPAFPWILLGAGVFILALVFRKKIFSINKVEKTEKGFNVEMDEDDEGKIEHNGKQYINAEQLTIYTSDQIDKTFSEIQRTLVDMRQQSELSFESEMKFAEEKWKVISYYLLDYYGQTIAEKPHAEVEKSFKYMEMVLDTYWSKKLQGQFRSSFRKNGFHTYRKVNANNEIVDSEMWSNFLQRIVDQIFHDFRHYFTGKFGYQVEVPINDLLEKVKFQTKKGELYIPGEACLNFVREIYENSWLCQEESRKVAEELQGIELAKRDALKLKLVIKG